MEPMMQKPWTDDDNKRLLKMKALRTPVVLIAKELGRTEAAVISRYGLLLRKNARRMRRAPVGDGVA
jgi:hypothetical protein